MRRHGLLHSFLQALRFAAILACAVGTSNADGRSTVVVELFTSEGCSSCPSAEKLVSKLADDPAADAVYLLAFHVDYWNRLGWLDRFSEAAFSSRQRRYARALGERVYTPQMIVDGKTAFVGSRGARARELIDGGLRNPDKTSVPSRRDGWDAPRT